MDLNLRWANMPKSTFSDVAANICLKIHTVTKQLKGVYQITKINLTHEVRAGVNCMPESMYLFSICFQRKQPEEAFFINL